MTKTRRISILAVSTLVLSVFASETFPASEKPITSSPTLINDTLGNAAVSTTQEQMNQGTTPNRLIREKSPYLLQHAFNPVDWYPWGEEAFKKARDEDKPIFLSIGYSTCYWCHVMEREVFEDPDIARLMNENLVCIKVDREERPDIDRVYMAALQAMTGAGGWPMSMFLTPDLKPFFGTTYVPPKEQYGRQSFPQIVRRIHHLWANSRKDVLESSQQVTEYVAARVNAGSAAPVSDSVLTTAFSQFIQSYDTSYAGFGGGPKFPRPVSFNFLLRYYARSGNDFALQMTLATLRRMHEGGMYDHLGGGFHRYSVDEQWRVPHFEKMLYDQAQLVSSYLDAYQITHDEYYATIARDVLAYVLRVMTNKDGAFCSAEDAESALDPSRPHEKEEGTFYLWRKTEVDSLLGREAAPIFCFTYGVQETGNALNDPLQVFTGKNILYVAHSIDETAISFNKKPEEIDSLLRDARQKLFLQREKRPRPHRDDKILTAWNGLMIAAFARAYQVLGDPKYLDAAQRCAQFILSRMVDGQTHLLSRRFRENEARFAGGLQDYSFLVSGLLELYEASFDTEWLEAAIALTKKQNELFWDGPVGGFYDTPGDDLSILVRSKEDYDGAEPTGNSIAALNLLRLASITANKEWQDMASRTIEAFGSRIRQYPEVTAQMLVAVDWNLSVPKEIIVVGSPSSDDTKALLREVRSHFIPNKVVLLADSGEHQKRLQSYLPFIGAMKMLDGKATAYICENYACQLPTTDPEVIRKLLSNQRNIKD